jgi:hypothetical protein
VPKLIVEDVVPLVRARSREAHHWCGAAALGLVLALLTFGGAVAAPTLAVAAEKGFNSGTAQEVAQGAAPRLKQSARPLDGARRRS